MTGIGILLLAWTGLSIAAALVLAGLWTRARAEAGDANQRADHNAAALVAAAARAADLRTQLEKATVAYRSLHKKATDKLATAANAIRVWKHRYERVAHWERCQSLKEEHDRLRSQTAELETSHAALRNAIDGYGRLYVVPPLSELDAQAMTMGHTAAGQRLKAAREKSRAIARSGEAATAETADPEFREASASLVLDAFNCKVDAILAMVRDDNIGTLMQRIKDAFTRVNDLGKGHGSARVSRTYLNARVDELKCAVTVHLLKQEMKEEQRQVNERMREEARVQRELEKAQRDARKQEEALLRQREVIERERERAIQDERAKQEARLAEELARVSEAQRAEYEARFRERLEGELAARTAQFEAQLSIQDDQIRDLLKRTQRAKSMAEQTKQGTVYVISNVGAFGEGVYKIGLTRRLDPLERVAELGDASVPFRFDVHALIEADDAPALERELHEAFAINQVNKMNWRKEFFRVSLGDIRNRVAGMGKPADWTMEAAAREYHETLALEHRLATDSEFKANWMAEQMRLDFSHESAIAADDTDSDGESSDQA